MDPVRAIKEALKVAIEESAGEGILLSGGIDSGLLLCLKRDLVAVSVELENEGKERPYLRILEKELGVKIEILSISKEEALEAIPLLIRILRTFDPALPNDLAVYFGLRALKERGIGKVITGDGGDELFGGYPFMAEVEDLEAYQKALIPQLSFSSQKIGEFLGLEVFHPFLSPEVVELSFLIPPEEKIKRINGKIFGKWILRKILEEYLPSEFVYQDKRPLEVGSGMEVLREVISKTISDEEFEKKKKLYGLNFLCKEHLYFYEVYLKEIGQIPPPKANETVCPNCGAGKPQGRKHCQVCGVIA